MILTASDCRKAQEEYYKNKYKEAALIADEYTQHFYDEAKKTGTATYAIPFDSLNCDIKLLTDILSEAGFTVKKGDDRLNVSW